MENRKVTHWSTRLLAAVLAFVMVLGSFPVSVFATENTGEEVLETTVPETSAPAAEITEDNPWNGRSAVFVGDSITAGSGTTKIYYQFLEETIGFDSVTAMGVAGSCISAASDYGQTNQPLINRYQNIPSADLIMIFMGTNDYGHETPLGSAEDTQDGTFYGALNVIIPALVAKHTTSKIVFVTPLHRYGFGTSKILGTQFTYDNIPNGVGATLTDYADAVKTVCANNGVAVIDLHTECTLDPADSEVRSEFMPDGLHPNAAGHELIAEIMKSHILNYTPSEKAPETEPEEETELIYGNKFASGFDQQNRASSRVNQYLTAGTVITLRDPDVFQWACAKTSDENSSNNLGYFPDGSWSDKETAVVEADGWVGFTFKYRDETQVFDLTRPLSDYITIHTHAYESAVTEPTCTQQGYTTHTCACGGKYVDSYVDAAGHSFTDYVSNGDATANTDGTKTAKCDNCDEMDTVADVGSAAGMSALVPLYREITVKPGQLDPNSDGEIIENEIYGYVAGYELKKGHTLSISDTNYVFSVRVLKDGNYSTMLKQATTASYTATEDMTIGMLIRKPDKSALTAEELASIVLYDSQYGMLGVEGYAHRFNVEAETIDGGTATTRAAIFLPPSYSESGTPMRLVIMTNGQHGHLRDNQWNANTADDVAVMKHYMDADYAVLVVDNTAGQTSNTSDLGNPQLVDSYFKAYEYVQENLNVEELFSIHSRSNGTFAAIRMMREHPELVKCALMTGAQFSMKTKFYMNPAFIANRFGFEDTTGATFETDKLIGYDAYTDVNGAEYSLPPTFWMLAQSDATTVALSTIDKIEAHGNDVTTATYTDTDHSGVCRLNTAQCWADALAYLNAHQTSNSEHRYCAWVVTREATCAEAGEMRRNCADCNHYETMELAAVGHVCAENEEVCTYCGKVLLDPLYHEISVTKGTFSDGTGEWVDSNVYGCVVGYELKKGHTLTISDTNYVFVVRQLIGGNYNTMIQSATSASFTATEDMIVAIRVRKPDSSALTAEELASIVLYDSQYGMLGVEGYGQRFTVEAETIDGGTATTRANIFLPKTYTEDGVPTKLIVMTNGYSAHLTDSVWNKNTADNVGIIRNYLNAGYAVWVVDNTAARTSQTPDLGCPQLVSSYRKAYEYIQQHFNVEEKFSIHSRSFGTFAAMRLMQEVPELIKCAVMTGPRVSIKKEWLGLDKKHIANRFGFADTTGATYEADKMVGYDPYTDVDRDSYALPPTYWAMSQGDATEEPMEVIEKLIAHGNDVTSVTHTGTDHTGVCTLNNEEMFAPALAFLNAHQTEEESEPMAMRYDDHLDLSGKTVEIVDAGKPTSYQVGYGVAEGTLDTAVVTLDGETLVATGIGTAKVRIDGTLYEVTVEAAPISLLLLIGQSNMQGSEGDENQSIVCPDGMVYATYGDRYTMTVNNATNFAPSALTGAGSALNVNGTTDSLEDWPVYLLNEAGVGKKGPDSGFAYEWVKQTGEKVWVVNAAHGGSAISTWQDGGANYEECVLLFKACQETLQKEIDAGHFTLSHMGYFWCQGCADYGKTAQWYVEKYLTMHENLKTELAFSEERTFEFGGIIPVRAGHEYYTSYRQGVYADTTTAKYHESFKDLRFTGPRVAQYWMINNPDLPDIWGVCNIGESWVTMPDGTDGVAEYFQSHYENGTVDYTTQVQQSASWYTPTTPAAVHDSIHYNQIGYNEVGREAVRNTLINLGEMVAPEVETSVRFLSWDGYTEVTEISAATAGSSATLVVPMVYPLWKAKEVTCSLSDGLSYNYYDLLAENAQITGTLTAGGKTVNVVKADPYAHFADHLSQLPEKLCRGVNLWNELEHDKYYYTNGTGWGVHSSGTVYSVTIPVEAGDQIYATSFGAAGTNGHSSTNGIRVTFFSEYGVAKTMAPSEVYPEFNENGGYLVAPEGAVAVNVAMWNNSDDNELYILNREHDTGSDICSICGKDSHTHAFSNWETVSLPAADALGIEQRKCACGETETREVEGVWQTMELSEHMNAMPESYCANTNLWPLLEHDAEFFSPSTQWHVHSSGTVYSVTIPVNPGEKIYASSFGKGGTHGGSTNGIRVTFFDAYGVAKTLAPADTYAEFTANGGYLIAPEGSIAVNIPMWTNDDAWELYILNREHDYSGTTCTICGAEHPEAADYSGKVISILGDSISTFAGYIPVADGFNLEHDSRYPQDNLLTDVNETWWMQVIAQLDAKLGINDSWRSTEVYNYIDEEVNSTYDGTKACMASTTRIQNLGSNGTPDVILFYGGTNDITQRRTIGTFDPATAPSEVDLTSVKWQTVADAYVAAIMRLQYYYPDAEIVAMLPTYTYKNTETVLEEYNSVFAAICEHYGVTYVDLRDCGITTADLPDGTHPDAEGMHYITNAVLDTLLSECEMAAGEHIVHSVIHELTGAESSLGYYKGVSNGKPFVTTITGEDVTVAVTMGSEDITESAYADGVVNIPNVTDNIVITAQGREKTIYEDHLQQLPEDICPGTNLWTVLEPENHYYTASGWGNLSNRLAWSVTISVNPEDQIFATSFRKNGENGNTSSSSNGIRVTWFDADGVLKSMSPAEVYEEFTINGYLTAPQDSVAVNIPMWNNSDDNELYILNREHDYSGTTCTICGSEHPEAADYSGKVISILGDSISTFAGYIPTADGFNLEHLARYPQDNLLTDVNETWWMQVIAELDGKLGINDSWRGATVSGAHAVTTGSTGENAAMHNLTRLQNLGSNGTPDVILFYGGTNDLAHVSKVGTFDPVTAPIQVDLTTKKWDNLAEAYVQTLLRLKHYYPDAQIVAMLPTYTTSYYSDAKLAQANEVLAEICDHYGVAYVDLRDCGITTADLPDGIHPDATGMDYITSAVLEALLANCDVAAGENVVYSVSHDLSGVTASYGYYKGISAGKSFEETLTADNDITVTVTMGGEDITDSSYADGKISIPSVAGDLVIVAEAAFSLGERLQKLPENFCAGTNLWNLLNHDSEYYTVSGWGVHASGKVYSVTIPVAENDRLWATSFGKAGENGQASVNGIRVTFFGEKGVLKSLSADETCAAFTEQGYLQVPAGAVAVNIPMWTKDSSNELYILNREHEYTSAVTAPTCTEQGYTTHTCVCGDSYVDSYVDATGHEFGDWTVITEPSCTEQGEERRDCENCDHFETREVDATGHSYDEFVTDPTCTEQGYTTHTCSTCGDSYIDSYLDATGHSFGDWTGTTEPTCTEKGAERRDCENCDYFETRELNAKGHSYEETVTAPTCADKGYTSHTCSICGDSYVDSYVDATGHEFGDWAVTTEPTCTVKGEERRGCVNCDHFETREVDATGHDYEEVVTDPTCTEQGYTTYTCSNCGDSYMDTYVDALGHSFKNYVSNDDATCTVDGTKTAKCERCDETDTVRDAGTAKGHQFGDWAVTTEPTCTVKSEERRDCENCDHFETREVDATGHSYDEVVTDPTCTEQGYTTHTCSACGDSYVDSYVDATGHSFGEWTITTAPTCTVKGEERRDCENCDHFETREVAATGHSYEEVVTKPTCTEQGYTTHTCSVCGDSYVDSYVNASGHEFGNWTVTIEATCTEKGVERRDCGNCDHFETREVAATGHDYEEVVTDPTCTEQGYTTHTCSVCGDSYVDSYVDATGHEFGNWTVTTEPTCTVKGEERRDCENCDHFETREVDATGHSYDEFVTDPTCTEQGYTTHTCSTCGDSYIDSYLDATGHEFGDWAVTTEPTCTVKGEERRECENCDHFETREVDATGHDYEEVVTKPTCTEQGYTTHTCSVCGDSYVDSYVNASGHEFGNWTVTIEPTCTVKGEERRECENCDHFETREVDATGHDYEEVVTKPTCTEQGYTTHTCSVCGGSYVDSYVDATGHSFGEWTITTAPTCTEKGEERRNCANCDHFETREVEATGHSYTAKVTEATCTEQGYTTHTCSKCDDSCVDSHVDALGHDFENGSCGNCGEPEKKYLYGDIDLDGDVDVDDVLALLWFVLFPEDYPITAEADFDASGNVDVDDVLALLWYVLFPDDYPLK